ncbi:hypothetical protein LCGC14_1488680 [marine sediment metagenome]|uniref:Uncharacterized protein n=1 Tax=marine sediment metagenome TaxID=412755 RepID=A0A0F9J807_9ZZZZ
MSSSGNSPKGTDPSPGLWVWLRNQVWRDNLARAAAYKSLGLPDSGTNIQTGLDWKGLAVIVAALLGGGWLVKDALQPSAPPPAPTSPADSEYEVRFYDSQGQVIDVPRLPERSQSHETKT